MTKSNRTVDTIGESVRPHHNTLYVNVSQFKEIKRGVSTPGLSPSGVDNVEMFGIRIVVVQGLDFALLCKTEDIFPTKQDWREDTS